MDSASTLATAKTAVFGKDPALTPDGQPLERGVGSAWHRAEHINKANFHAATAWALCDELVSTAKALLATAEKISAAAKLGSESATAAKAETPVPPDPKDSQVYKDLQAQYDQVVAERDVYKNQQAMFAVNEDTKRQLANQTGAALPVPLTTEIGRFPPGADQAALDKAAVDVAARAAAFDVKPAVPAAPELNKSPEAIALSFASMPRV